MCEQVPWADLGAECGVCGCLPHTPCAFGCLLHDEVVGTARLDEARALVWLKPSWLPNGGSAVDRGPCFLLTCSQCGPQRGASLLRPPTASPGHPEVAQGLCCPSDSGGLDSAGCSLPHGRALPLRPGTVFLDVCVARAQDPLTRPVPHLVDSCTLAVCFSSQHG